MAKNPTVSLGNEQLTELKRILKIYMFDRIEQAKRVWEAGDFDWLQNDLHNLDEALGLLMYVEIAEEDSERATRRRRAKAPKRMPPQVPPPQALS